MIDQKKTKNQPIDELPAFRKQVAEVDSLEKSHPSTLDEAPNPTTFHKYLLENIDEGILVTDKDDKIFFVNNPVAKIAGVPKEQILGVAVLRDFSEDTLRYFRPRYLKARETLNAVSFDSIEVITPAGRLTYQSGTLVPIVKDGHFDGMICTIHDITERKRVETALEKRIVALTRPLDDVESIAFEDLFNLSDLQCLQDLFAEVWGVASIHNTSGRHTHHSTDNLLLSL